MYGLIGFPLGHSFSADFFNSKFEAESIPESYSLFPLEDINSLPELLKLHPDLKGLNVTIPYKQKVLPFLDSIDKSAKEIGAVNVIKILSDGSLKGYNSDVIGFSETIKPLLQKHMKKALVLGTGGASKAVVYALHQMGIQTLNVSRDKHTENCIRYSELSPEIMATHHVIVNTTPLGMWPEIEKCPEIPYNLLTPMHLCYDLVYNPETTTFMSRSMEHGATVKNGLGMLIGQAIAAWNIWTNKE